MNVVDNSEPLMDENGELSAGDDFDEGQLFDFTLLSSETMGWLNHYATEVAYRRVLLSPRRPLPENNLARRMDEERNPYDGFCKSRCTTFRQWTAQCQGPYCQDRASKPEGFIRRAIDGLDETLEKAIYPPGGDGISGGLHGGVGIGPSVPAGAGAFAAPVGQGVPTGPGALPAPVGPIGQGSGTRAPSFGQGSGTR